jgi:hypothetical protein
MYDLKHIFTCSLSSNDPQASSIHLLGVAYLELALLNLSYHLHLMSSSHGLHRILLFFDTTPWGAPNPHINIKYITHGLGYRVWFTSSYYTITSLDLMRYIIYVLCSSSWSQSPDFVLIIFLFFSIHNNLLKAIRNSALHYIAARIDHQNSILFWSFFN